MARKSKKRTRKTTSNRVRGRKYSAGELFMAGLGALLLVLVAGMIVTSLVSR